MSNVSPCSINKEEIYEMGVTFAIEGLDETYFKHDNDEELEIFRKGYQEGLKRLGEITKQRESQSKLRK